MIQRLQKKRNEEGFTLIELLIVIIVLGILAAIVVFAVGTTRDDAAASACKTDVKSVQLSAEAIKTTKGSYPLTDDFEALYTAASGGLLKAMPGGIGWVSNGTTYTITPSPLACPAVSG